MTTNDPNNWIKCPRCGTPCYAPTANGICAKCNLLVWPDGRTAPANMDFITTGAVVTALPALEAAQVAAIHLTREEREKFAAWFREWCVGVLGDADPAGNAIDLIAAERRRQIEVEGFTAEHDDRYAPESEQLARAAACYAMPARERELCAVGCGWTVRKSWTVRKQLWPWLEAWWKPTPDDRIRELVKAGALIAAEIDRLQRASGLVDCRCARCGTTHFEGDCPLDPTYHERHFSRCATHGTVLNANGRCLLCDHPELANDPRPPAPPRLKCVNCGSPYEAHEGMSATCPGSYGQRPYSDGEVA